MLFRSEGDAFDGGMVGRGGEGVGGFFYTADDDGLIYRCQNRVRNRLCGGDVQYGRCLVCGACDKDSDSV